MDGISTKLVGACIGTGLGGATGTFLLWLLGGLLWGGSLGEASAAAETIAAVPTPVSTLLLIVLAIAGTAVAGYYTPERTPNDA